MEKPGLQRAIPMAVLGFILGALIVIVVRSLQNVEPVADTGVIIVLSSFMVIWFFLWGMGAFNPKMSEHAHAPGEHEAHEETSALATTEEGDTALATADEHEAHEEEEKPFAVLSSLLWRVATYSVGVVLLIFFFAQLPTGLRLDVTASPEASISIIDSETQFDLPFGLGEFVGSQLAVFLGFVAVTMISILIAAGLFAAAVYYLNRDVTRIRETETTPEQTRPPAPVRWSSRQLRRLTNGLRRGIPAFFGYKN